MPSLCNYAKVKAVIAKKRAYMHNQLSALKTDKPHRNLAQLFGGWVDNAVDSCTDG